MAGMTQKRIGTFDLVKGFAMLCIVAGHFSDGLVCRIVFTFHVPVFFLIGGFFFHPDRNRLMPRIVRLLKPYVFTVFAVAILDMIKRYILEIAHGNTLDAQILVKTFNRWLLAGVYGSGSRSDFFSLKMPVIGAVWFLLAYAWVLLFMELGLNTGKNLKGYVRIITLGTATAVLFLLGWWSAKYCWLPFSFQAGCVSLLFFAIGYNEKRRLSDLIHRKTIVIMAAVIWAVAVLVSILHDCMSIVRCAFPDLLLNISGACAAEIVLLSAGIYLENQGYLKRIRTILELIGRETLVFLSFHLIELNVFPWRYVMNFFGMPRPLETVAIYCLKVIWCLVGITAAKKLKLLKKVFY